MKLVLVALMFSLVGPAKALAADIALPPRLPGVSYLPAATYNWAGGYLGLNGGYAFGSSNWSLNGISSGSFNTNGFLFGGTLGGNFQTGRFVFGLEADLDWSGLTGSTFSAGCGAIAGFAGATCQTKSDWLSTARGRIGYAFDRALLYATGGLALAGVEIALTQPAGSDSFVEAGWTVGGGVEVALTDNWTAKAEYLFVDFGKITCHVSLPVCNTGAVSLSENVIRAGVNYKFNW
jgi:outer membrane immunogenic protein